MPSTKIHRDQIHGDVRFDPLSVALLNTPVMQRLGRVYQLGFAHLVYRGGTHTRLSHVMGAYHVAGMLVNLLRENYEHHDDSDLPEGAVKPDEFLPRTGVSVTKDVRWDALTYFVRWAALLHDVGHVPLGHTLEDEFDKIYKKHDDFASPRTPYLWFEKHPTESSDIRAVFENTPWLPKSLQELGVGGIDAWHVVMLICFFKEKIADQENDETFEAALDSKLANPELNQPNRDVISLLRKSLETQRGKLFFPYMTDIVANTICADYLDYLQRDSSNVGLDVLRDKRVASRFFIGKDRRKNLRMALSLQDRRRKPRLDTCTGVVELVRQRFRFAEIIYYHKTKVAASAMLAKVFALSGQPNEVRTSENQRLTLDIAQIDKLAESAATKADIDRIRRGTLPAALLDPEIGDESLILWLQERTWRQLDLARLGKAKEGPTVADCLHAIALLQGLADRRLYKVCLTIGKDEFEKLTTKSTTPDALRQEIKGTSERFRGNVEFRSDLERKMASAAGWPSNSLLLYVPPRKAQAKGIETGALDKGEVITLEHHEAVREEVKRLNEKYENLWRIIVLVHPNYALRALGLSKGIDVLLTEIWHDINLSNAFAEIREAAWFPYVPIRQRSGGGAYVDLIRNPDEANWELFFDAGDGGTHEFDSEEHACRAYLMHRIRVHGQSDGIIRSHFPSPGMLRKKIEDFEPEMFKGSEGRETSVDSLRSVLDRIMSEFLPDGSS